MAVRIEKSLCTVLRETHKRQVEETMDTLAEGRRACTNARNELVRKNPQPRYGLLLRPTLAPRTPPTAPQTNGRIRTTTSKTGMIAPMFRRSSGVEGNLTPLRPLTSPDPSSTPPPPETSRPLAPAGPPG